MPATPQSSARRRGLASLRFRGKDRSTARGGKARACARGKGCEFFEGFGYDFGEHPACSIGGERAIWKGGAVRRRRWALPRLQAARRRRHKETPMLWTIFVILLVLWLLGMVTSYTLGGFIHILLVIAVVVILIRIIQGRRPIP